MQSTKKNFEHNYPKYWDKYSAQKLADYLSSDTLVVSPGAAADPVTIAFYRRANSALIADLEDDHFSTDSLYPMHAFNQVTIKRLPLGFTTEFTTEQTERFLQIINDPVSFDWAETTDQPEYRVAFLQNDSVVAALTIGAGKSVIKTEPGWPIFKKMKFGHLKTGPAEELIHLISEPE